VRTSGQREFLLARNESEIASLRDLSARVGSDPLLVQASNGNTSIKLDGILWIKASGKWLAHAKQKEIFVAVALEEARRSIQSNAEIGRLVDLELGEVKAGVAKDELWPSIETPMHAVLQHRVVIHVHSINAIAWAIRLDGPNQLQKLLAGLRWRWIPYAASGNPLAREIEKAVAGAPETDVLVLGNHGLVVCGDDCVSAERLLGDVERRLAIAPRRFPKSDASVLKMIARFSGWQFPEIDRLHALGTDATSRRILKGGVLYPCQAIFLGQSMPLSPTAFVVSKFADRLNSKYRTAPFVAVEKSGVMINERMTPAERATLHALVEVTLRTPESAPLRYLNGTEVAEVLSQGAHGGNEQPTIAGKTSLRSAGRKLAQEYGIPIPRNMNFAWLGNQTKRLRFRSGSARSN
jgi:rhamnose utilization protein RhaD (predicted bifunctional aldolase and dehydrogenase)